MTMPSARAKACPGSAHGHVCYLLCVACRDLFPPFALGMTVICWLFVFGIAMIKVVLACICLLEPCVGPDGTLLEPSPFAQSSPCGRAAMAPSRRSLLSSATTTTPLETRSTGLFRLSRWPHCLQSPSSSEEGS